MGTRSQPAWPHARPASKGQPINGMVVYPHHEVLIQGASLDQTFRDRFRELIAKVGGASALPFTPSYRECRFCDIPSCASRIVALDDVSDAQHGLF